jgi:hypothetical protein
MAILEPLDLEQILITNLSGTPEIFSFIAVILVSIACAYFRLSNAHSIIMIALLGVIMSSYLPGLYVIIILFGGISIFYAISKIAR